MLGEAFGPYRILGKLGEGGMGEVYRARDGTLNRDVAIKVLPESFALDADRVARFTREAQVLASLNHPNIAQIYSIEESGSTRALAMELVEGEDLSAHIARGAIPLSDALPIARQIASALEAAHEQGIVHRDLKPANIKITEDGTVKVLDFGLAKALDSHSTRPGDHAATASQGPGTGDPGPTMTSPAMTALGMILGTAGYMAPEQAKGKAVDRRADIWALGVVLFEMLAGRQLYQGETVTEMIAHVITQPPDWSALPASTPAPVRRLLRRCLEKDPRNRLQSAGDARLEIDEILSGPAPEAEAPVTSGIARAAKLPAWRRALPWTVAAALLVALGYQLWPRPVAPARPARLEVLLTPGEDLPVRANSDGAIAVLSPDGQTLVYLAATGSSRQLFVRRLDQLEGTPLAGTENAVDPFFSPDGASVAFFANGQLIRVALAGGPPTPIAPAAADRGGSWGPDDSIVFAANIQEGLSRVSARGGTPAPLTRLEPRERTHRWPHILPGGKHVLFMCQPIGAAYDDGTIEAARMDTGERKVLIRGGTAPRYVGGYLVYARGATLYAVRFDPRSLEMRGEAQPVLSGLLSSGAARGGNVGGAGAAQISIADNGTAVYLTGTVADQTSPVRLVMVDRSGRILYEYPGAGYFRDPSLSPDGRKIALRVTPPAGRPQLYLLDPGRGTLNQITFDASSFAPVWSHDGRSLAFATSGAAGNSLLLMPSDGSGAAKALIQGGAWAIPTSFSPDDRELAMTRLNPTPDGRPGSDLEVVSVADSKVTPFLNSPSPEQAGRFSPDGRWMTFLLTDPTGIGDIYVRAYPDGGALRRVSTGGGFGPRWSRNGREIVYVDFSGNLTAVDVSPEGGALVIGNPRKLFELPVALLSGAAEYDVATDGNRFVMLVESTQPASAPKRTHVTMVFNFLEELRRATAGAAK